MPPKVFKNKSSTSNIPTLDISCSNSTVRLNKNVITVTFKNFLLFSLIIGNIKANGTKAPILPNILMIKLSSPIDSL